MGQDPEIVDHSQGHDGGPHAGQLAFAFGLAHDGVVGGDDGGDHHVRHAIGVDPGYPFDVGQGPDGDGGGRVASRVPAHAVAHGHQMLPGEGGVLVVVPHVADVGYGAGTQDEG